MCDVAGRLGAKVVRVEAPWGRAARHRRAALGAHGSPAVIALVHAETSTGVRNEVELLGGRTGEALLIVDCVTSLGGIPVEVEAGAWTSPTARRRSASACRPAWRR